MTLAAPAVAATGDVNCPSTDCVRIAPAAGSPVAIAPDNAGAVYLAYSGGDLLKLDLATGALSTVTTGLGNLRGVAVAGGNAYITNFDGALQQVSLATGSHRTLAAGLPSLFGVARFGITTYAIDTNGELIAVPDGGTARVVATGHSPNSPTTSPTPAAARIRADSPSKETAHGIGYGSGHRSRTVTRSACRASTRAVTRPTGPAPTTRTSASNASWPGAGAAAPSFISSSPAPGQPSVRRMSAATRSRSAWATSPRMVSRPSSTVRRRRPIRIF